MVQTLKKNAFLLWCYRRYRYLRLKYEKNVLIGPNAKVSSSSKFEGNNAVGENSRIISCHFGNGTYVANDSYLIRARIGKFTSIGPFTKCILGNHPTKKFVSTHPSFFSTRKQVNLTFTETTKFPELSFNEDDKNAYGISIENDVWIGANVTILDGVSIGNGAIVAANSLVNKDVAPYTIVGGVPAKPIKSRFTEEQIEFLLNFKWWNKSLEWINQNADLFDDIHHLMNKYQSSIHEK